MPGAAGPARDPHPSLAGALVGLSCRLPGAHDVQGFWDVLGAADSQIGVVPASRWHWQAHADKPGGAPNTSYSSVGGFIDHVDCFDCGFFRISPREAAAMDPMQRLFLQAGWGALEDGGYAPRRLSGMNVGVFVGVGHAEYAGMMRAARCDADAYRGTGMALTLVANRISYLLNLQGPSEVIDTACSSSLVALHRAVEQLRAGHCELAIAGGINLMLGPELHVAFSQAGMLSVSQRCRPFEAAADGYVRGEGMAALVLKPLELARRDGDFIYATIAASAQGHGGRAHSLTAPNFRGQAKVIASAWAGAGAAIDRLSYVETHGTGTALGDPVEVAGLIEAWRSVAAQRPPAAGRRIALGTLKGRIGHLEAASGVAGVLKAVLALRYGVIPPNLDHGQPNPQIDLAGSPFDIIGQARPWWDEQGPKLAGVSSFGFGGLNAHVVLEEEAPAASGPGLRHAGAEILILSAGDREGLAARAQQLLDYLYPGAHPQVIAALGGAGARWSGADASGPDLDAPLALLGIDEAMLSTLLDEMGARFGASLGRDDVRDCLSLGELAAALSESLPAATLAGSALAGRLAPRASLPRSYVQPTLRELATSLSLGRDLMRERFVIVSGSMSELARQLAALLNGAEAPARTLQASGRRAGLAIAAPSAALPGLAAGAAADALFAAVAALADQDELALALRQRYSGSFCRRIPLPSMPFRLDRAWFTPAQGAAPAPWSATPLLARWRHHLGPRVVSLPTLLPWPQGIGQTLAPGTGPGLHLREVRWAPPPMQVESIRLRAHSAPQPMIEYQCVSGEDASTICCAVLASSQAARNAGAQPLPGSARAIDLAGILSRSVPPWRAPGRMTARLAAGVLELSSGGGTENHEAPSLHAEWTIMLVQALQVLLGEHQPRCLLLPFRAAELDIEAGITGLPERLRLHADPLTRLISVQAWQGGRQVLHLSGLEVREAPWSCALLSPSPGGMRV